jgi:hypothetical protein
MVAFPWWDININTHPGVGAYEGKDRWGVHNGVGPRQTWWTVQGANTFYFQFGNKPGLAAYDADGVGGANTVGLYGCPTDFDGHIPQVFATWTNGLEPGSYYMRVWINGFVQTDINGAYMDYMVNVPEVEWAGDIYVPIDVQLSGKIEKTIHFQGGPGTLEEIAAGGPDPWRFVIVEARDSAGTLVAFNFTQVLAEATQAVITLNGFGMAGPVLYPTWDSQIAPWHWDPDQLVDPTGMKFFLYNYRHIRDYGMMPGTYTIYVYMRGFVQQEWELASISLSGQTTYISNHIYAGAGINMTVWSIDWQTPKINREWQYCDELILIDVFEGTCDDYEVGVGRVFFFDTASDMWILPTQDCAQVSIPYPGWPYDNYLKFHGAITLERQGPDETIIPFTYDDTDEAASLWWSTFYYGCGFLTSPGNYRDEDFNTVVALETGEYTIEAQSYGYVFKYPCKYDIYVTKGTQADTKIELVIGVKFNGIIIFKKEGLVEHLPYDAWIYIWIEDEDGNVVADAGGGHPGDLAHYATAECTEDIDFETAGLTDGEVVSSGVDGYANYLGDWTVHVSVSYTGRDVYDGVWYPPPPGLLLGGDSGPYEMRTDVIIPNAPLSGEASFIFELDQRALVSGQLAAFSESNELRTISWASIMISGAEGDFEYFTYDGRYEFYAPMGDYEMTITEYQGDMGHYALTQDIHVPDGGAVNFGMLVMERSNTPIPEFPIALLPTLAALGASLYLLRRKKE